MGEFENDLNDLANEILSEQFLNGQKFYKWFVNELKSLLKKNIEVRYAFDYDSIDKSTNSIMTNTFKWFNKKMSGKYHFLSSESQYFEKVIELLKDRESMYNRPVYEIVSKLSSKTSR